MTFSIENCGIQDGVNTESQRPYGHENGYYVGMKIEVLASLVFSELQIEDPAGFKNFTRMSVPTFEVLMQKVGFKLQRQNTQFRESISPQNRLLVTLRFLATGYTFQSLSFSFRISVPALSLIVPETLVAICDLLKEEYMKIPSTSDEWKQIAHKFYKLWNFPMCLGSLDGKHIAFRPKKNEGSFYYNYKGFHSIVLLALVDAEYNFTYVNIGCNGRVSDGGVFQNSGLNNAITQNALNFPEDKPLPNGTIPVPYVIVADEAFKASHVIMKPWGQRYVIEQKIFNYRLSRARRVVENVLGIMCNRFQILQKEINQSVEKVEKITLTCCILHNFLRKMEGKQYLFESDYENTATGTLVEGEWRKQVFTTGLQRTAGNRASDISLQIKREFTNYFNGVGAVDWQNRAIQKFNF